MAEEFFRQVDTQDQAFETISRLIQKYADGKCEKSALLASYQDLVAAGSFDAFVHAALRKTRDDPSFVPGWITSAECAIVANRHCTLSIRRITPETGVPLIYAASGTIVMTLMSSSPVVFDLYKVQGPTAPLQWAGERTLTRGDTITVEPFNAFRCRLDGSAALVSRMLIDSADFTAVYDASSLDYISMLSLDTTSTRWYFMAKLAGQLESTQAALLLEQLTAHHNYNVRWTALQELFNHDLEKAIGILNLFKTDASEFIRDKAHSESDRIAALLSEGKE